MATFLKTRENTKKLYLEGHYYYKSPNIKNNLILWDCADKRKFKCPGRVITRNMEDNTDVEIICGHNCENEGHHYFKSPNSKNNLIIWECSEKRYFKCPGRVITRNMEDKTDVEIICGHNCENEVEIFSGNRRKENVGR
ncbi:unnamed protein product [Meloidogyne enterolobii]|uniref:Uncharacterized protein n=1 Tax=Meloidogyne enterolobii TaxID=390850 RepID=A0ACB1A822_MELEN